MIRSKNAKFRNSPIVVKEVVSQYFKQERKQMVTKKVATFDPTFNSKLYMPFYVISKLP